MSRCADLEPLLASYVDGEASAQERETVEIHLGHCPPCRDRITGERAAREVLTARRTQLKCCAPDQLKRRCAEHGAPRPTVAGPHAAARAPLFSRRTLVPLSMAATIMLAVAGVFFFGLTDSVEALAAQLAIDHVKCFQFPPAENVAVDAKALGDEWTSTRGWSLKVPPSDPSQHLQLLTVRRCASTEGITAHMMYKWRGQPFSVYVLNGTSAGAPAHERIVQKLGQDSVVWSDEGRTYAVVANVPRRELEQVALYVRRTAR